MQFYQSVFGGELPVSTFGEVPGMPGVDESEAKKVMHSMLEAPNGFTLMGADTPAHMDYNPPVGMMVSLSGDDEAVLRGYWDALADGATFGVPLGRSGASRSLVRRTHVETM